MIIILLAVNIILNIYCILERKNNRIVCFFSVISIMIIMGLNSFNSDYNIYSYHYNAKTIAKEMEPGFSFLVSIAYKFGLSYAKFIFAFMLGCIIIAIIATQKMSSNYHVVLLVYMITAIFLNTDEVRQTGAYAFYTLGLVLLQDKKGGKIKYCIMVLLASSMHISAIVLLPFPFIMDFFSAGKGLLKIFFASIVMFCMIVFMNGNKIPLLYEIASALLPPSKMIYFVTGTHFGFLLFFFGNALNLWISWYGVRLINRNPDIFNDAEKKYSQYLLYSILYLSFAMPLCMVNGEFLRYFRFSVFPCIILISILFKKTYLEREGRINSVFRFGMLDAVLVIYALLYQVAFQHFRVMSEVLLNNHMDVMF